MFRYIAFIWDTADPSASATARRNALHLRERQPGWRFAFDRPGLIVLYCDARANANAAYALPSGEGVILGKLFRRDESSDSPAPVADLSEHDGAAILRSGGAELVERFWGRYVAFLAPAGTGCTRVLRDPAGTMPCFGSVHAGVRMFFSWTEDALESGLPPPSVNWSYMGAQLALYAVECRETALTDVYQLLGGERMDIRGDTVRRTLLWDPHRFAADAVESPAVAAGALRCVVRTCARSWSSCYQHTLVRLSGGLDSSILVSCLGRDSWDRAVTCVNYYVSGSDSDERHYARVAAGAAQRRMIEREQDAAVCLERMLTMARTPKPTFYVEFLDIHPFEAAVARDAGAAAVFTGTGGDQLFYRTQVVLPAVDFARRHGLRPSLARSALDAAHLAGRTIWSALATAVRDGWIRRSADPRAGQAERETLVPEDVIEHARRDPRFLHPALQEPCATPPGKLRQLRQFLYSIEFYDPLGNGDGPEYVHPLLSQPLIELCLRIPTYVLINGGWDRALARQAFANDLPSAISRRRSKGGSGDHYKRVLLRNLPFVRAMLLQGALVREGLLDGKRLEEVLSGRPSRIASSASQLHTYLGAEIWARRWTETRHQAAA